MNSNKKRRGARTSTYQYETYLEYMENSSYTFRSGTVDPTLPPNFIEEKWEELVQKLNGCDVGPILSVSEWQTRFTNWKNSTRQKARFIIADHKKTGGGTGQAKTLSALEERGLMVWGQAAVTGTPKVSAVGGLQHQSLEIFDIGVVDDQTNIIETTDIVNVTGTEIENVPAEKILTFDKSTPGTSSGEQKLCKKRKFVNSNNSSIKRIGAELLETYKNDSKRREENMQLENKKIILEKVKLQFEVAKYKFQNPNFQFDLTELSQI